MMRNKATLRNDTSTSYTGQRGDQRNQSQTLSFDFLALAFTLGIIPRSRDRVTSHAIKCRKEFDNWMAQEVLIRLGILIDKNQAAISAC
jgi:hypothetical protein